MAQTPTFRVIVVSRNVQAVNYRHHSGSTKLDFAGTDLMLSANGEAKVNSKRGSMEIEAEFGDLEQPTTFGTRVSDLCLVGDFSRRAGRESGRSISWRQSPQ